MRIFAVLILAAILAGSHPAAADAARTPAVKAPEKADPLLRKRPGRAKFADVTLKRGYVAPAVIADWRRRLRPALRTPDMRAMSPRKAARARDLQRRLRRFDALLERWQRSARRIERLQDRRALAVRRGADTATLDRELSREIRKAESLGQRAREMGKKFTTDFGNSGERANQRYRMLSSILKSMNEARRPEIRNLQ